MLTSLVSWMRVPQAARRCTQAITAAILATEK